MPNFTGSCIADAHLEFSISEEIDFQDNQVVRGSEGCKLTAEDSVVSHVKSLTEIQETEVDVGALVRCLCGHSHRPE